MCIQLVPQQDPYSILGIKVYDMTGRCSWGYKESRPSLPRTCKKSDCRNIAGDITLKYARSLRDLSDLWKQTEGTFNVAVMQFTGKQVETVSLRRNVTHGRGRSHPAAVTQELALRPGRSWCLVRYGSSDCIFFVLDSPRPMEVVLGPSLKARRGQPVASGRPQGVSITRRHFR